MRALAGVVLGLLLFFPGIILLQWLSVSVLGLYSSMTLTDGALVMVMILLSVNLMYLMRGQRGPSRARRTPASQYDTEEMQFQYLNSNATSSPRRRRTSRRKDTTR